VSWYSSGNRMYFPFIIQFYNCLPFALTHFPLINHFDMFNLLPSNGKPIQTIEKINLTSTIRTAHNFIVIIIIISHAFSNPFSISLLHFIRILLSSHIFPIVPVHHLLLINWFFHFSRFTLLLRCCTTLNCWRNEDNEGKKQHTT
jgi:hypothetical protein